MGKLVLPLWVSLSSGSPLQRGICIDSSKEPEYLLDLRGFRRIDVVKIQGECKSIIAIKIEEH